MRLERPPVAVVTDSCSSLRPEYPFVGNLGIKVLPITISFFESGGWVSVKDLTITPGEFYRRMQGSSRVPLTSGAIGNEALEAYREISKSTSSIFSLHISSKLSAAYSTANLAKDEILEELLPQKPELKIEVIDSRQLSFGQGLLVEEAAILSRKGASLEEIKSTVLEMIPKVQVLAVFNNLENLKRSGRMSSRFKASMASLLSIRPIIGVEDGSLVVLEKPRSFNIANRRMLEIVGDGNNRGHITKMVVIHTYAEEAARELAGKLTGIRKEPISIYDAGPVIGVHGGPGGVGVAVLRI